jgi:AcrR family transcriptional regulator
MSAATGRTKRRGDALSKERIVEMAIAILDTNGEDALTFRALAERLATGSGAIYWHVADKDELLAAATDAVITRAMGNGVRDAKPLLGIRAIALAVFDAFDAHPWVGGQMGRRPWGPAMLQIYEGIGGRLLALGAPKRALFDAWSVLVNYILGVGGQNAANARLLSHEIDRTKFLANVAAEWARLDLAKYPFVHQIATQLREHDDREQFLAGVDLILAGIGTLRQAKARRKRSIERGL